MVTPGLYKHYKGGMYRVLFVAEWLGAAPAADEVLEVALVDGPWLGVFKIPHASAGSVFHLLSAKWSTNTSNVLPGNAVVIYVSLYETGRVSARVQSEFEEMVDDKAGTLTVVRQIPRFERIGD